MTLVPVVLAIFQALMAIILLFIGLFLKSIIRGQEKIEKKFDEFKDEVLKDFAKRTDISKLENTIEKLARHVDIRDKEVHDECWNRIHKVVSDDIDPIREDLSRMQSDISVLKEKTRGP